MKRGALHFLGRKNQSLFDSNLKVKEMVTPDNVELLLDSSAIPESGTAKVRSRPTVKHYISSSEVLQGFNVPTPTVPVIPTHNEVKTNGLVSGDRWSNGSALSVPDLVEEEIMVPPPPSVAPPPPPALIIPPPPDFMGNLEDLEDLDLASIQPPSMPPPKPPSLAPSLEDEDLSSLRPPPMAPPKPPSTCSSASSSSLPTGISTPPLTKVPDISEHPKCAPPQSPAERQHKAPKIPPPKPVRLSSIPSMDGPPQNPAPPPPVHAPTPSSFNPQNTAKLYSVPKNSLLTEHVDRQTRPKSILVLEDSVSLKSVPVTVQVNGKTSSVAPLPKPVHTSASEKDLQDLKATLQATLPSQKPASLSKRPPNIESVSTPPKVSPKLQKQPLQANLPSQKPASLSKMPPNIDTVSTTPPPKVSPKLQKQPAAPINSAESNQAELDKSPSQSRQLIDCKLRNLKGSESSGVREGPAATPLSLLMAAKERDKHRSSSSSSLSRENSTTKNEPSTASIQPVASNPNSFVVIPRAASSSSLTSQGKVRENTESVVSSEPTITNPTVGLPRSPALVQKGTSSPKPDVNRISNVQSSPASSPVIERQSVAQTSSPSESAQDQENEEEVFMPLLPPPPEFANADDFDEAVGPPPSAPAPDPPVTSAPSPAASPIPSAKGPSVETPPRPSTPAPDPPVKSAPSPAASPIPSAKGPSVETPPRPSTPAPDPPVKSAPSPAASPVSRAKSPSPLPKPTPPPPPKLPPPETDVKPKLPVQTKSKSPLTQSPTSSLLASQATLLSILQKKMLEMDHKITPVSEPESNGDDWGNPLSDEETSVPAVLKAPSPKNKTFTIIPSKTTGLDLNKTSTMPGKTTGLDMRELESKVAKKYQEKGATSNGPESKQQYGMTFTVRPGTKQPITLVSKGESS